MEISVDEKKAIIKNQVRSYNQQKYDWEVAAKVSAIVKDSPERKAQVANELARCIKAIDALEKMLAELENPAEEVKAE